MAKNKILLIKGTEITISNRNEFDYTSLTDIAKYRNTVEPFSVINNWMRGKSTIEFIGLWEKLNNPGFKPIEFERFRSEAGNNYFVLSQTRRKHQRLGAYRATCYSIEFGKYQRDSHSTGPAAKLMIAAT